MLFFLSFEISRIHITVCCFSSICMYIYQHLAKDRSHISTMVYDNSLPPTKNKNCNNHFVLYLMSWGVIVDSSISTIMVSNLSDQILFKLKLRSSWTIEQSPWGISWACPYSQWNRDQILKCILQPTPSYPVETMQNNRSHCTHLLCIFSTRI